MYSMENKVRYKGSFSSAVVYLSGFSRFGIDDLLIFIEYHLRREFLLISAF